MANLYPEQFGADLVTLKRTLGRSARAQRVRIMLVASGVCAFGMVAVMATVLAYLI